MGSENRLNGEDRQFALTTIWRPEIAFAVALVPIRVDENAT
jgi:hypothetical protein